MEKTNKKQSNYFLRGLIWGAILGAGVTYYLKTESGKQLLKKVKEQALDQLANLGETMVHDEEEIEPMMPVHHHHEEHHDHTSPEPIKILHVHKGQIDTELNTSDEQEHQHKKSPHKKLFKGIGKK